MEFPGIPERMKLSRGKLSLQSCLLDHPEEAIVCFHALQRDTGSTVVVTGDGCIGLGLGLRGGSRFPIRLGWCVSIGVFGLWGRRGGVLGLYFRREGSRLVGEGVEDGFLARFRVERRMGVLLGSSYECYHVLHESEHPRYIVLLASCIEAHIMSYAQNSIQQLA